MQPEISVILPSIVIDRYFEEAVFSLQAQTFENFECLICHAGQKNGNDFLEGLTKSDPRFILLAQPGMPLPQSLQKGVENARAPFLARMDADDIALPARFERQLAAMREKPETALLGCSYRYIDAKGRFGRIKKMPARPHLPLNMLWGCPFLHPGVMMRKEAVLAAGGYRSVFQHAEDYDLWFRLMNHGRLENMQEVLMHYRIHGNNKSVSQARDSRRYAMLAQALYFLGDIAAAPDNQTLDSAFTKLAPETRAEIVLRMLACNASNTGDELEDAEASGLFQEYLPYAKPEIAKKAMRIWHLRCAKRYCRTDWKRMFRHIYSALALRQFHFS